MAIRGARVSGEMRRRRKLSPSTLERRRIWAVTVVPMLAPMMIHTAWFSVIMPALTKPTTITVVAEED